MVEVKDGVQTRKVSVRLGLKVQVIPFNTALIEVESTEVTRLGLVEAFDDLYDDLEQITLDKASKWIDSTGKFLKKEKERQ